MADGQERVAASGHGVQFECGHSAVITDAEYGDGSAWCLDCDEFQVYERCRECGSLDCDHTEVPGDVES